MHDTKSAELPTVKGKFSDYNYIINLFLIIDNNFSIKFHINLP